jgi:hypothetical protein
VRERKERRVGVREREREREKEREREGEREREKEGEKREKAKERDQWDGCTQSYLYCSTTSISCEQPVFAGSLLLANNQIDEWSVYPVDLHHRVYAWFDGCCSMVHSVM